MPLDSLKFSDALRFRGLWLYNFLSFGPDETYLNLSESLLTAVIGVNYDTGGEDSRNGTGKTALMVDAICYAIFGKTLRGITSANLVHKLARKGQPMQVILEYSRGPFAYRIERGENPSRLLFFKKPYDDTRDFRTQEKVDGKKVFIFDLTQGKVSTNPAIIQSVGFDLTLFGYLVANTSEAIPFVKLPEAQRRDVIESLFGFKRLSEIAEGIKMDRDALKTGTVKLESGLAATVAANTRVQTQIDGLLVKQAAYYEPFSRQKKIAEVRLGDLIQTSKALCIKFETNAFIQSLPSSITDRFTYVAGLTPDDSHLSKLQAEAAAADTAMTTHYNGLATKMQLRLAEIENEGNKMLSEFKFPETSRSRMNELKSSIHIGKSQHASTTLAANRLNLRITTLEQELTKLDASQCPACGQPLTAEHRAQEETKLTTQMSQLIEERDEQVEIYQRHANDLPGMENELMELTATETTSNETLAQFLVEFQTLKNQTIAENKQMENTDPELIRLCEVVEQANEAYNSAVKLAKQRSEAIALAVQFNEGTVETNRLIEVIQEATRNLDPAQNPDPYTEQIESLRKDALVNVEAEKQKIADNRVLIDHYQLLVDLATKPDSFIRKQLIDRWLPRLNGRIAKLLKQLELPHRVRFDSEMEMHITMMREEYSNGNLSKGERTRLIVAVNLAFQELFEQMNYKINLLVVDELLDSGLDARGASNAISIFNETVREQDKRAFLITHRSDIRDQVDSTLTVFKESDFSHLRWENQA